MKMVLDTNVVVTALRSPSGSSAELLRQVRAGSGQLLLSTALVLEYEATCELPEHLLAAGLERKEVGQVLDVLAAVSTPVKIHYRWRPQLHDPGDEMVLETAVNGGADAIVTYNKKDFGTAPQRFGIDLLSPPEVLARKDR